MSDRTCPCGALLHGHPVADQGRCGRCWWTTPDPLNDTESSTP